MTGVDKFQHQRATVKDAELSHAEFRVLMFVWSFMGQDGTGWVHRPTIYRECPVSNRKVDDAMRALVARGYLRVLKPGGRREGGAGESTSYALSLPSAPEGAAEDSPEPVDDSQGRPQSVRSSGRRRPHSVPERPHSVPKTTALTTDPSSPDHPQENQPAIPSTTLLASVEKADDEDGPASATAVPDVAGSGDVGRHHEPHEEDHEEPTMPDHDDGALDMDALAALDQLQAEAPTPDAPDWPAELNSPEEAPSEEWDEDHPEQPNRTNHHQQPGTAGGADGQDTSEADAPAALDAPAAALARFRAKGHPARSQALAGNLAANWGMPA